MVGFWAMLDVYKRQEYDLEEIYRLLEKENKKSAARVIRSPFQLLDELCLDVYKRQPQKGSTKVFIITVNRKRSSFSRKKASPHL